MKAIITIIMWLMFVVVIIAWAVVGLILWIPLLARATTVFSAMVVHATITGQRPDALRSHLESASRFYPEGFRIAFEVVHKPTNSQPQPVHIRFGRVFGECLWTVAFWILLLMVFHASLLVPLWSAISVASATVREWFATVNKWWFYAVGGLLIFLLGLVIGILGSPGDNKTKQKD